MSRVADMYVAPAFRRWTARLGLAVVVAIAIAYVPGQVLRRDPRTTKLRGQLDELDAEARELAAGNAALVRDIRALRTSVGAIEDRARADLGMVYPDEIVMRVVAPAPPGAIPRAPAARPPVAPGGATRGATP